MELNSKTIRARILLRKEGNMSSVFIIDMDSLKNYFWLIDFFQ